MDKNIGNMTESELKDFIIELQEDNSKYERKIEKLQQENEKLNAELMLYRGSLHREHEAIYRANDFEDENKRLKNIIDRLKKVVDECWYMDSENVGEQVFLKKCELKSILEDKEETNTNVGEVK